MTVATLPLLWVGLPIAVVLVLSVAGLVLARSRPGVEWGAMRRWVNHPVVLTRGHLLVLAVALTLPACTGMIVSLIGRVKLNDEVRQRIIEGEAQIKREQVTQERVRLIAKQYAMLARPTQHELARRSQEALEACGRSMRCRVRFTQVVNRVLRVTEGRIVPAPPAPRAPPAPTTTPPPRGGSPPAPSPPSGAGPQSDPRVPQLAARVSTLERRVDRLAERPPLDSRLVDGLENRVGDLERGVSALGGRVQQVVSALCVPSLAALLKALRLCQ